MVFCHYDTTHERRSQDSREDRLITQTPPDTPGILNIGRRDFTLTETPWGLNVDSRLYSRQNVLLKVTEPSSRLRDFDHSLQNPSDTGTVGLVRGRVDQSLQNPSEPVDLLSWELELKPIEPPPWHSVPVRHRSYRKLLFLSFLLSSVVKIL